jgi:hypothetical protein
MQNEAEVGFVDGLGFGKVPDGDIVSGFQHVAPTIGATMALTMVLST